MVTINKAEEAAFRKLNEEIHEKSEKLDNTLDIQIINDFNTQLFLDRHWVRVPAQRRYVQPMV